jgi:hypothetical protein
MVILYLVKSLGDGMGGLRSSTADFNSPQPAPSAPPSPDPGGLLGMIQEYMRNNRTSDAAR